MSCNSTGGGGGGTAIAASAAALTAETQLAPAAQNEPWEYGDNDGYRNLGHANTMAGKKKVDEYMGSGNGGATDQWVQGLTQGEKHGVYEYTGSGYEPMNKHLRKGTYASPGQKKDIAQTTEALKKGVLEKPTIFHRGSGAGLLGGASTVEEIQAMVGQIVTDKGFTSSSASTSGAFGGQIAYHIKTPAGTGIGAYVRPISNFHSEMEFLFQRSSSFRVAGAYKDASGKVHCNLEYVGNDL